MKLYLHVSEPFGTCEEYINENIDNLTFRIGPKSLDKGVVEIKNRLTGEIYELDKDDLKSEIAEFEDQLKKKDIPEDIQKRIEKEIKKLKNMSSMSAEATVVRNYIDWLVTLPWNSDITDDEVSIDKAQNVLDEDHFGLEKPKERITEFLAVRALTSKQKGPILCLVGPPGVGKGPSPAALY